MSAIKNESLADIQNALGALAEQDTKTAARILQHIRSQEEQDPRRQIGFVTGQDHDGNRFVSMRVTHRNGWGGTTSLTIDSNGQSSATHCDGVKEQPKTIDATTALELISEIPDKTYTPARELNPSFQLKPAREPELDHYKDK